MGLFCTHRHVLCQNDEVSPDVHTPAHAKWTPDTPTGPPQQAAPGGPAPHLAGAVFSTDPVLASLHLIMTETGI